MEKQEDNKTFNHQKAGVSDKIALIGELEHIRRHALRSAVSVDDEKKAWKYLIIANQAQTYRREFMRTEFPGIADTDWCLCKSAACLRQVAYEIASNNNTFLKLIDNLVDDIWGNALNMDLSDCEACRSDREKGLE